MHLYERFEVSDDFDGADGKPARTRDLVHSTTVVIYRGALEPASRPEKLARADRIYNSALEQSPARDAFELFTTNGSLWLVAPSEAEAAPLIREFRAAALLPTPALPPPTPKCAKCGAPAAAAGQLCAKCTVPPPVKRSYLGWWLTLIGLAAIVITVVAASMNSSSTNRRQVAQNSLSESPATAREPQVSFTADPAEVPEGGSAELRWNTSDANFVSINHGIGLVPTSGIRQVKISSPTTFELTATGPGGNATRKVTVTVTAQTVAPSPPVISLFMTDQQTIRQHETIHLRWITHGATSLSLQPNITANIADPGASNSAAVTLDRTTTFTLTARGEGGSVSRSVTVEVIPAAPPTATISANNVRGNTSVMSGEAVRLCWQTSNANSVAVNGEPVRSLSDCENVMPSRSTTYSVSASGPGGHYASEVQVLVLPRPAERTPVPQSPQQPAQPSRVASGELVWSGNVGGYSTPTVDIQMQWTPGAGQWQPTLSSGGTMHGVAIPYPMFWMSCVSDEGGRIGPQLITIPKGGGPIRIHYTFRRGGNHTIRIRWEKIPDVPGRR